MQFIVELWTHYLVHVVDILIVTYIIYRIILLVKGTRAVQILVGILTLLVITLLAQVFHFQTLGWLLENFWLAAVVIIAVVFQPEIRSALVQLGSQRWAKFMTEEKASDINEVVEAVRELSETKTGALIVFEREIGLKEFIETGTIINAIITREIIVTILSKESPLHDGAIIIKSGLLVAAACVLPLSSSASKLSSSFGTRHSAGLGLSEVSDAVVVILSEETGKISIASAGKIIPQTDPDGLRKSLTEIFSKPVQRTILSKLGLR